MRAHDIIIKPILTEKSYAGIANKVYTFKVAKDANKVEIRKAIEEIFGADSIFCISPTPSHKTSPSVGDEKSITSAELNL